MGCGSEKWYQIGALANGTKDSNPRFAPALENFEPYPCQARTLGQELKSNLLPPKLSDRSGCPSPTFRGLYVEVSLHFKVGESKTGVFGWFSEDTLTWNLTECLGHSPGAKTSGCHGALPLGRFQRGSEPFPFWRLPKAQRKRV